MKIDMIVQIELYENFGDFYPLDKKAREWNGLVYLIGKTERITEKKRKSPEDRSAVWGRSWSLSGGEVCLLPQNSSYYVELYENYVKCYVINFLGEVENDIIVEPCPDLLTMFEEATRLWERHREDEYYQLDCIGIANRIFAELCRRHDRNSHGLGVRKKDLRKKERLAPVLDRIHSIYSSPELRISELAALIGVSERCLSETFTDIYGISPKRYLTELRLKRAKELLLGDYSIGDIAQIVGYRDIYHFSNSFKDEFGITPSEYRRKPGGVV